jgi:uncharacterized membrane protein
MAGIKNLPEDKDPKPELSFYAVLAYIPVVGLCSLFSVQQSDEDSHFHSKQGFVLFGAELFGSMVRFVPVVGGWLFLILVLLALFCHIKAWVEMYRGNRYIIPGIGKLAVLLEL